jgi:hypothetical protein
MLKQETKMILNNGWQFRGKLDISLTHDGKNLYHSLASFQSHEGREEDYYLELRGEVWGPADSAGLVLNKTLIASIIFTRAGDKVAATVVVNNPEIRKNVLTGKFITFAIKKVKEFLKNEMAEAKPGRKKALYDLIVLQTAILRKRKRFNRTIAKLISIRDDMRLYPEIEEAYNLLVGELSKVKGNINDNQLDSGGTNE